MVVLPEPYAETTHNRWEFLLTAAVGVVAYALLWLWEYPFVHPQVWEDVSIAAGLRPPSEPFPGVYRGIVGALFLLLPRGMALDSLAPLAHAVLALSAMGVYVVFRDILPGALRLKLHMGRIGQRIGRMVAMAGALLFLCADPMWRAGQTFSPATVFIGLTVLAVLLFFSFVRRASVVPLYFCFAVLGVASAETMLAMLLTITAAVGVLVAAAWASNPNVPLVNPFVDGLVRAVVFKRLANTWAACFAGTVAANVVLFVYTDGLEAAGHPGVLGVLLLYLKTALESVPASMAPAAWLFGAFVCILPFVVAVHLMPRAWDDDRFLPYAVGALYGLVGVASLTQLGSLRLLWFWTWIGKTSMVPSDSVLAFFLMFNLAAVVFSLAVFGVDACCRNYRRIAHQQFPESMQYVEPAKLADSLSRSRIMRRNIFVTLLALVPVMALPSRVQSVARGMLAAMRDYVDEVERETRGCDAIITDGTFDPMLELAAWREGRSLATLSMMAPNTTRERIVRKRVVKDAEDSELLESDVATALRTWTVSRPERLSTTAVQLGFECWRRNKLKMPPASGLAIFPGGLDPAERKRAITECSRIASNVYMLMEPFVDTDNPDPSCRGIRFPFVACPDVTLREKFSVVPFRISRLAQLRSSIADADGDREESFREAARADEMDYVNYELAALKVNMDWRRKHNSGALTPREGLVIGLSRADFVLAAQFAAPLLKTDPDDPRANFAVGMKLFQEMQYSRAAEHLRRCLVRRPEDPAVLNNLAVALQKIGELDEAEKFIRQALAKHPSVAELKKTLSNILGAKEERQAAKQGNRFATTNNVPAKTENRK